MKYTYQVIFEFFVHYDGKYFAKHDKIQRRQHDVAQSQIEQATQGHGPTQIARGQADQPQNGRTQQVQSRQRCYLIIPLNQH